MGFFKLFRTSAHKKPRAPSVPRGVAYATWSCLGTSARCREEEGVIWIPGLANPPKPKGCRCDLVYTFATERGASEMAAFIRKHGGIARLSEWEAADENPRAIERRRRQRLDAVILKEKEASQSEETDPDRTVDLYREAIAGFTEIASLGDRWTWRRLPYCYNRLSMMLERLHRPGEALETIRTFDAITEPMHPTKSDAEEIAKRRERLLKPGQSVGGST